MDKPQRYLAATVREDALRDRKMAFISGPRQVGKTTLAKLLLDRVASNYFSWDEAKFRRAWSRSPNQAIAERDRGPIAFDEIHKDRRWKWRLKGLYDTLGEDVPILVTGSARLDLFRRGGDSLSGRYLPYHLHPFSVAESSRPCSPDEAHAGAKITFAWKDLLALGGFPEPLLAGNRAKARRWSMLRLERLVGEDVRDLRAVSDLSGLRVLVDLLPGTVGSLLSINALREDVGAAYATVRDWVLVLEALYHCFFVRPYARRLRRAVHAVPKLYLFDVLQVEEPAARQENLVALHLLKAVQFWTDSAQGRFELHYVRDKEQHEVDFLVLRDGKPWWLVECKSDEVGISPSLGRFQEQLGAAAVYQLTTRPGYDRFYADSGTRVLSYEKFLAGLI